MKVLGGSESFQKSSTNRDPRVRRQNLYKQALPHTLVRASIAVIKDHERKHLGSKGCIPVYNWQVSVPLQRKLGQELKAGTWRQQLRQKSGRGTNYQVVPQG